MADKKTILVGVDSSGIRLDVFLSEELGITRSQVQKLIDDDRIYLNGKLPKKSGDKLKEGYEIEVIEDPGDIKNKNKNLNANDSPQLEVKIIATTPDYLVIDKPSGMLTHSTERGETNSLAEILLKKYPEIKKVGENPLRPGIVHRLDKEASGLLVVARNNKMFEHLKEEFKDRTIEKEYIVLVHGAVDKDSGEINFPLERSKNAARMAALPKTERGKATTVGKYARTEFWVEKRFINFTLLRIKILTGRMHQIRAHMLAFNHPVVGDPLYFQKKQKRTWDEKAGRLFLHCAKLCFTDSNNKKVCFISDLPPELVGLLKKIK